MVLSEYYCSQCCYNMTVPLLAGLEDTDERQELGGLKTAAYQALQDLFVFEFGQLTTIKGRWEERRAAVIDILPKVMKFTFTPAL